MTSQQAIILLRNLEQSLDDYCELNDEGKTAFCKAITALELFGNSEQLPPAQPEQKEPCSACEGLEDGDTLYAHSEWDGGIGFDYIYDIKYCPVCGRRLNTGTICKIGGMRYEPD